MKNAKKNSEMKKGTFVYACCPMASQVVFFFSEKAWLALAQGKVRGERESESEQRRENKGSSERRDFCFEVRGRCGAM